MIQQLFVNGVIAGSIYALIAIGFTVIYSTVKFFHFAHGVVYNVGSKANKFMTWGFRFKGWSKMEFDVEKTVFYLL